MDTITLHVLLLAGVFAVIIAVLWLKKPLWMAIGSGCIVTVLFYRIPIKEALTVFGKQAIAWETIAVLLAFYVVTYLQKMLEQKDHLKGAQSSFDKLLRNRRWNAMVSPAIIGLLPSAAVMSIAAEMVDNSAADYLDKKEKMMTSCYYRHLSEMFLPTYSVVLVCLQLTGVNAGAYVVAMIPMVILASLVCYLFYIRKLDKNMPPVEGEINKGKELVNLLKHLWSLVAVLLVIIIFDIPVYIVTPIVIAVNFIIDKFSVKDILPLAKEAAEPILLGNMFVIMLFKGIITYTGVVSELPVFFSRFPLPASVIFCLIFFFGTIVSGSQAMVALCMPMAMASVPNAGLPIVCLLMAVAWGAMELSPTHVCSFVAGNYFKTTLGDLVGKAWPVVVVFCVAAYGYYMLLSLIPGL